MDLRVDLEDQEEEVHQEKEEDHHKVHQEIHNALYVEQMAIVFQIHHHFQMQNLEKL
jgi:hypothetical protein